RYLAARQRYEAEADAYWSVVADKRRLRVGKRRGSQDVALQDYVLTQPPLYAGPPPPIDPSAPTEEPARKYVPIVADFLRAAAQEFKFVPQPPRSEIEYKRLRQGRGCGRAHARAGGPHLRVRVRRQRQVRRAGGARISQAGCAGDFHRARLQPALVHQ